MLGRAVAKVGLKQSQVSSSLQFLTQGWEFTFEMMFQAYYNKAPIVEKLFPLSKVRLMRQHM